MWAEFVVGSHRCSGFSCFLLFSALLKKKNFQIPIPSGKQCKQELLCGFPVKFLFVIYLFIYLFIYFIFKDLVHNDLIKLKGM